MAVTIANPGPWEDCSCRLFLADKISTFAPVSLPRPVPQRASALSLAGGSAAAQTLAPALRDEDSSVREEAFEALEAIGGETATRVLTQALSDPDESVRTTAAEILNHMRRQRH